MIRKNGSAALVGFECTLRNGQRLRPHSAFQGGVTKGYKKRATKADDLTDWAVLKKYILQYKDEPQDEDDEDGGHGNGSPNTPKTRKPPTCSNCQEQGHTKRGCTNPPVAPTTRKTPNSNGRKPSGIKKQNHCSKCKGLGHNKRNCPGRVQVCTLCGVRGHNRRSCPTKKA